MGKVTLWTVKEIAHLRKRIKEKASYKTIGEELGKTTEAARKKALHLGIKRNKKMTAVDREMIAQKMRDGSQTVSSLAKKTGYSVGAILRLRRKKNIPPLPKEKMSYIIKLRMKEKGYSTAALARANERQRNFQQGWPMMTTNGEAKAMQVLLDNGNRLDCVTWARLAGIAKLTVRDYIQVLRKRGVLLTDKEGRKRYYRLTDNTVENRMKVLRAT